MTDTTLASVPASTTAKPRKRTKPKAKTKAPAKRKAKAERAP